jgi:hypothetical protein
VKAAAPPARVRATIPAERSITINDRLAAGCENLLYRDTPLFLRKSPFLRPTSPLKIFPAASKYLFYLPYRRNFFSRLLEASRSPLFRRARMSNGLGHGVFLRPPSGSPNCCGKQVTRAAGRPRLEGQGMPRLCAIHGPAPGPGRVNVTVTAMPAGHGSLSHGSLARCFTRAAAAGRSRPGRRRHSDGDCPGDRGRDRPRP